MKKVGEGALSEVFQAMHIPSRTTVAVKLYTKATLTHFTRRQIEREVELQSRLRHPHIVQLVSDCSACPVFHSKPAPCMAVDMRTADLCNAPLKSHQPPAQSGPACMLTCNNVLLEASMDGAAVKHHSLTI